MKIFTCKQCVSPCGLLVENNADVPQWCPYPKNMHAKWQESKAKTTTNSSQLPDWVKECAVGYDNEQKRYFEVTNVSEKWVDIEYLDDGNGATCNYTDMQNCSEARKRPFNEKEMKALVGNVLETPNLVLLVDAYGKVTRGISTALGNYTAESLMDRGFVIDGKPCFKLEHLEKGEWVE